MAMPMPTMAMTTDVAAVGDVTTARETRAETLVAWLQRLQSQCGFEVSGGAAQTTLTVHLLGADHREGSSGDETCAVFRSFSRFLASETRFRRLRLVLVGPNLARSLHLQTHTQCDGTADDQHFQVELRYFVCGFEQYFADQELYEAPDLVACFNAGIWGYDEWWPTIRVVLHQVRAPLLVTSYNEKEAGDDEDALDDLDPPRWLWRAEKNPRGAHSPRATSNSMGEVLKENNYWMCLDGQGEAS